MQGVARHGRNMIIYNPATTVRSRYSVDKTPELSLFWSLHYNQYTIQSQRRQNLRLLGYWQAGKRVTKYPFYEGVTLLGYLLVKG